MLVRTEDIYGKELYINPNQIVVVNDNFEDRVVLVMANNLNYIIPKREFYKFTEV